MTYFSDQSFQPGMLGEGRSSASKSGCWSMTSICSLALIERPSRFVTNSSRPPVVLPRLDRAAGASLDGPGHARQADGLAGDPLADGPHRAEDLAAEMRVLLGRVERPLAALRLNTKEVLPAAGENRQRLCRVRRHGRPPAALVARVGIASSALAIALEGGHGGSKALGIGR